MGPPAKTVTRRHAVPYCFFWGAKAVFLVARSIPCDAVAAQSRRSGERCLSSELRHAFEVGHELGFEVRCLPILLPVAWLCCADVVTTLRLGKNRARTQQNRPPAHAVGRLQSQRRSRSKPARDKPNFVSLPSQCVAEPPKRHRGGLTFEITHNRRNTALE